MPVAGRVAYYAQAHPNTTALCIDGLQRSYAALAKNAARVAVGLRRVSGKSVRTWMPDDGRLLAVDLGNRDTFAELFVGATAASHACAVLDPEWDSSQACEVVRRLAPDLLVTDGSHREVLKAAIDLGIPALNVDDAEGSPTSYLGWLERSPAELKSLTLAGHDDTTFLVGFTSGTTGVPKAFRKTRRAWRTSLQAGCTIVDRGSDQNTLALGSLTHSLTLYALAEALVAGATFAGVSRFDSTSIASTFATGDVARLVIMPTMLQELCETANGESFTQISTVVSAGAKLSPQLASRARTILPNACITEYYGASEVGFVSVGRPLMEPRVYDPTNIGYPFPGVEVEVRDDAGNSLRPGTPGILFVRSHFICDGYVWGDGSNGFSRDGGWATVGDVAWLDDSGAIHLVGREGGTVVTSGVHVYAAEVEAVLRSIADVDEAVAVGVPDANYGAILVAVVSGRYTAEMSYAEVAKECLRHLSPHKVPRRVYAIRRWPLTPSGKIARRTIENWVIDSDSELKLLPKGS